MILIPNYFSLPHWREAEAKWGFKCEVNEIRDMQHIKMER